jgi:hypothetical protein
MSGNQGRAPDDKTCGARKSDGGTCRKPAGWGTEFNVGRCRTHGGNTRAQITHTQKALATQAVRSYGIKSDLPPRAALLEEAQWSHGHVVWLRDVVQMIDPDALVWGVTEEHEKTASEFPGVDVKKLAAPNVWLKLYHEERRLHLDLVKTIETLKLEQGWLDYVNRTADLMEQIILLVLAMRGVPADEALPGQIQAATAQVAGVKTIEGKVA